MVNILLVFFIIVTTVIIIGMVIIIIFIIMFATHRKRTENGVLLFKCIFQSLIISPRIDGIEHVDDFRSCVGEINVRTGRVKERGYSLSAKRVEPSPALIQNLE